MKVGDLVKPKRRTAHHMVGVVVEIDRPSMSSPILQTSYRVYFHTDHINSEHQWVSSVWFNRGELDLVSPADI